MNRIYKTLLISAFFHTLTIGLLAPSEENSAKKPPRKVKVQIREIKKEPTQPIAKKEEKIPPKPKKKVKKKKKVKQKVPTIQKKTEAKKQVESSKPVLGLSKDSFAKGKNGAGVAVPAGNTTMIEDKGERLRPDQIAELEEDLSRDAELIVDSFIKPSYTIDAEDAGLEGRFVLDVYVDAEGFVKDAQLRKRVGFGMDDRLVQSVLNARFNPRKNALGRSIAGWTEVKIRLTLE